MRTWHGAPSDILADTIGLKSGEAVEGSIIDATRNTVIVRREIGGMRQMRIQDLKEIRIDLARGQVISGQFVSWTDGVYQLRSGGEVIRISEGRILSHEPRGEATVQPPGELLPWPREELTATIAPPRAVSAIGKTATLRAESDGQTVVVKASVDPDETNARGMVFKVELSHPAAQPVVLIYGTLDGTAKASTDYEPRQGVITLAPGTTSAEMRVTLIEHQPTRGATQFELFRTADPKVAEIRDERIIATIQGDD
jgi:hypothetical protein